MSKEKKKVFLFAMAASGHINPLAGIISELVKNNVHVVFYSTAQFKPLVEKLGAEYREYTYYPTTLGQRKSLSESSNSVVKFLQDLVAFSIKILPDHIRDVERDRPDLILFDKPMNQVFYLDDALRKKYARGEIDFMPPPLVEINTMFAAKKGVYPPRDEFRKVVFRDSNKWAIFYIILAFFYQIWLNLKFGLNTWNPMKVFERQGDLQIVTIFPEIQPRLSEFERSRYKFVGCCIEEQVRGVEIKDPRLKETLDLFPPDNPLSSISSRYVNNRRLVYVSLGTMDNKNSFIFYKAIEAIKLFQERSNHKYELKVVISLGEDVYNEMQEKISKKQFQVPEYFVLQKFVPQIEVLKRASLFISHVGMNSLSET